MIIFNSEYELPKLTISLAEDMEKAAKGVALKERLKARYDFLAKLFTKEQLAEIVEGQTFSEADTRNIDLAFILVQREYSEPIREAQRADIGAQMEAIEGLAKLLDSMANAAKSPVMNRQIFRAAK